MLQEIVQKLRCALTLRQVVRQAHHKAQGRFLGLLATVVLLAAACGDLATPISPEPASTVTEETTSTEYTPDSDLSTSPSDLPSTIPEQHFRFERISLEQGLSQSSVLCMLQDSKGFLWFGTEDGLNKYDGHSFAVYRHVPGNPNSLSHNYIRSIYEDREGVLWIGTDGGGLDRFDRDTGQFVHYQDNPRNHHDLSGNYVRSICEDREGVLWIGTDGGGLNRFDRSTGRFIHYHNNPSDPYSLSGNVVWSIYEDREGMLWIGTDGGGLNRFDRSTERFIHCKNDPRDPYSLSSDSVWSIYKDREDVLWVGTDGGGLNRFDRSTERFIHYQNDPDDPYSLSNNSIRSIYEDREGVLWIGTFGGGLDIFDRENERFIHYQNDLSDPQSLSNNMIWSIYEDREGILWVGTHGGGVNKCDRSTEPFVHYQADPNNPHSLSNNMVRAIYQDREGVLWIGTNGGGLNRLDRSTGRFTHYQNDPGDPHSLSSNMVRSICEDREGVLWVGTGEGGLDRLDRSTERFIHYQVNPDDPDNVSGDPVLSIHKDQEGVLWIGTFGGGLSRFDRSTERAIRYKCCLSNDRVMTIYEDRSGALWIGTGLGLNRLDRGKGQFTYYLADPNDPKSLSHNAVMSIHEDQSGVLWIGTFGGGLNRFDRETETFTYYREGDGLSNDMVYGILEDSHGCLWLSTNRGLSRFNPRTETFRNYDVSDGLQSNEFNGGAYYKSRSGEMFFGGINGLNAFYPDDVKESNPYVPPVVLTSLTQTGEEADVGQAIEDTKEVTFRWPNNFFEFEFAALSYARPEKNQYAYMLEGLEEDWIYAGTRRFGRYTSLPGGTYTLRIKGSNNDGVWNEEGVSVRITIVPPFWETWWFRGIIALVVVGSAIGGHRLRIKSIEARSRELETLVEQRTAELRQEIDQRIQVEEALRQSEMEKAVAAERSRLARDLHDVVTQTLFSSSLIAEALPTSWERDQKEGKQLLQELRQLTRGALAEMRTLLLELRPAALVEASLGDLLRQLAEAATGREGMPVAVTVEGQCTLPFDVHIALYRIAQEALNNVVKHACASHVAVSLRFPPSLSPPLAGGMPEGQGGQVTLSIRDDGRGFDPDGIPSDRLGLGIMRERAQAIGATLLVESGIGHGTEIVVTWSGSAEHEAT